MIAFLAIVSAFLPATLLMVAFLFAVAGQWSSSWNSGSAIFL
jgi:hypothetical protein